MLIKIAMAVVLIVVALVAFIATRPAEFRISRSRMLAAPPEVVYARVNDFHKWLDWSPWEKLDPVMRRDYSGAPAGPGAEYFWSGNRKVGEGRMTITDSRVPQSITIRLEFIKPCSGTNTAQFDFAPGGSGTSVTWTMSGRKNFMSKAFCLFIDMDKMVGSEFEKGLANLDAASASAARGAAPMHAS